MSFDTTHQNTGLSEGQGYALHPKEKRAEKPSFLLRITSSTSSSLAFIKALAFSEVASFTSYSIYARPLATVAEDSLSSSSSISLYIARISCFTSRGRCPPSTPLVLPRPGGPALRMGHPSGSASLAEPLPPARPRLRLAAHRRQTWPLVAGSAARTPPDGCRPTSVWLEGLRPCGPAHTRSGRLKAPLKTPLDI